MMKEYKLDSHSLSDNGYYMFIIIEPDSHNSNKRTRSVSTKSQVLASKMKEKGFSSIVMSYINCHDSVKDLCTEFQDNDTFLIIYLEVLDKCYTMRYQEAIEWINQIDCNSIKISDSDDRDYILIYNMSESVRSIGNDIDDEYSRELYKQAYELLRKVTMKPNEYRYSKETSATELNVPEKVKKEANVIIEKSFGLYEINLRNDVRPKNNSTSSSAPVFVYDAVEDEKDEVIDDELADIFEHLKVDD